MKIYLLYSKSSGYFKYKVNSNAPKAAQLTPVAKVNAGGSVKPKERKAILEKFND